MIVLSATNKKIQVVLAGAITTSQLDCYAAWRDFDSTTYVAGDFGVATNSTTDVDLVAAPAASHYIVVDYLSVYNKDTAAATVSVKYDVAGTEKILWKGLLAVGYKLEYAEGAGFRVLDTNGAALGVGTPGANGTNGAPGAPGVGTTGTAVLQFGGYPGASDASVAVTGQAGIVAGSVVEAWLRLEATGDHSADEHWVESIEVYAGNIVAGTGFTIYGKNLNQVVPMLPARDLGINRTVGPGTGVNQVRQGFSNKAPRLYGEWNVQWRWS